MTYNFFLACIAVGFGFLLLIFKNKLLKIIFGSIWLLFLPNTIYIFTDLEHLIYQWHLVPMPLLLFLLFQYAVFEIAGILTFFLGFLPFERFIQGKLFDKHAGAFIIALNFLIAFGMVLGRVERINSWEVIIHPLQVVSSAFTVLTTFDLLGLTLLFGLFCNFLYFLFRDQVRVVIRKYLQLLD